MREHYLLLTPGPLSTTPSVKAVMLKDWCTWDDTYKHIVQLIRSKLLHLGRASETHYTSVLMQGSGTFGIEATIGTVIPQAGKLLILANGVYGKRIEEISRVLGISYRTLEFAPNQMVDVEQVNAVMEQDTAITHVAFVHCETTTGILNPLEKLVHTIKRHGKIAIVDAMSSFGGLAIEVEKWGIDYLISSSNKCIQGVPGFSFILSKKDELAKCKDNARSLSLDLYDQWQVMDQEEGKWRFTSPTHVVRAFYQALLELEAEGGVERRYVRYLENQQTLVRLMESAGFKTYLPEALQSPIITTFMYPDLEHFTFESMYLFLKEQGYVIYPGKLSDAQVFRIGSIGDVHVEDMVSLCAAILSYVTNNGE
ncbi:2-aminoethylphosphonate--pyruvate transaminase [Paenibacillus monticola]|uniref:2-aminoethylphosphonate--pyruvate transaminase n=1 Tax=Paenibacillus monticola TaxID=2666075 RepID=A0A7X2L201_9BACL|nr:2-aminoethylphosphonate--pyruvate transaminase [Paenibacillus monticola]MRN53695.1 2-aminoethylphosphonate--pyruvate transaminase [Paenibacillus monticola]